MAINSEQYSEALHANNFQLMEEVLVAGKKSGRPEDYQKFIDGQLWALAGYTEYDEREKKHIPGSGDKFVRVVELLLNHRANIEGWRDTQGQIHIPLQGAASAGNVLNAKLLLARGAKVNSRDRHLNTPLHSAAAWGNRKMVNLLLDRNAAVDSQNDSGETPIFWAAFRGHSEVVTTLADKGARVNLTGSHDEDSIVFASAASGDVKSLEIWKKMGADLDSYSPSMGCTPLIMASFFGKTDAVKYLVQEGAKLSSVQKGNVGRYNLERFGCQKLSAHGNEIPSSIAYSEGHFETAAFLSEKERELRRAAQAERRAAKPSPHILPAAFSPYKGLWYQARAENANKGARA